MQKETTSQDQFLSLVGALGGVEIEDPTFGQSLVTFVTKNMAISKRSFLRLQSIYSQNCGHFAE